MLHRLRNDFRLSIITLLGASAILGITPFAVLRFLQGNPFAAAIDLTILTGISAGVVYAWRTGGYPPERAVSGSGGLLRRGIGGLRGRGAGSVLAVPLPGHHLFPDLAPDRGDPECVVHPGPDGARRGVPVTGPDVVLCGHGGGGQCLCLRLRPAQPEPAPAAGAPGDGGPADRREEPPLHGRGAADGGGERRADPACPMRWRCWTSTTSRKSTTSMVTALATRC